jgi:hypothetical protein
VITLGKDTKQQIIHDHHDLPAYGHPGISRTTQLVTRYYWWPQIARDVHDYVKGCAECQRHKVNTQARKAPFNPITPELDALPFQTIAMDFIVKLLQLEGYDSILTITDHDCSKAAIFIPCNETIDTDRVADLYLRNVFVQYGLPSKVICDRDPCFISRFMQTLCKWMGIKVNASTAYHPRMDGQSERSNQWLEQWLRPWTNFAQNNWHKYLPFAEFAHNSWHNETTKKSPFQVLMGYHPRASITPFPNTLPGVETQIEEWTQARQQVREAILIAQKRWAHSRHLGRTFKIGDKVWLEGHNLRTEQPTAKLAPKHHGPFPIKKVLSPITYQLTLPLTWKIHDVFHVDLLTPYIETDFHGPNYTRPPPDLINEEEEYEVEQVLSSRHHGRGCKVQYLVKWRGYPDSDNEWVNWDDMHAEEALEDFRKQNPRAITHIRRTQSTITKPTPTLHSWIYSNMSMSQDAIGTTLPYAQCKSPVPTTATTITTRPLIDQFGMVLPHTPPSPTLPPTLLFNSRVETPASWPPSDDMGIETHTPIYVPSRSPSPGTTSWAPIAVPSCSPSPFWPGGPRPTPEKGVDTIPVVSMGSDPGSPIPGTPEYNYDLTSPPSPKGSPSSTSSSTASSRPAALKGACTAHCWDMALTLHHHDHLTTPSDKSDIWTSATLIEEPAQKNKRVWGYGMTNDQEPKWQRLDRWEGWEEEDLESLRSVFSEAVRNLTLAIQNRGQLT